jgi:hypothetical protein
MMFRDLGGSWRGAIAALAVVLALASLLMVPAFGQPGPEDDEGLLVAYPARLLDGALPQGDYYDSYGPGSVWTVAAADELFGTSVGSERVVGMAYRLAAVAGAFALGLCWGLGAALIAAAIVASPLVGSVAAPASVGFLALALPGYALLALALLRPARTGRWLFPLAGALLGASMLMRFDFLPAVVLAALPPVLVLAARERRRFLAGAVAGLAPLVVHVGLVGPSAFWRSARVALGTRGHPPRPPFVSDLAELVALYALATALLLVAGALIERRARRDPEARVLLGGALWGLALTPFALTKLDEPHVLVASIPVLALLPAAAIVIIRGDLVRRPTAAAARRFALASVAVVVFFAGADSIRFPVYHQAKFLLTGKRDPSVRVSDHGRSFRIADPQAAHDVQVMLSAIDSLARPGNTLFVGPQDLSTAGASDVFLYFMLPQLKPASYFMAVDPHTINRARNGFARELPRADFLILTTRYTHLPVKDAGPQTANQILAARFCVQAASGTYRLYQRCR